MVIFMIEFIGESKSTIKLESHIGNVKAVAFDDPKFQCVYEMLKELELLKAEQVISSDEFEVKKARLLNL